MKHTKKFLALICVVALLLTLTACGKGGNKGGGGKGEDAIVDLGGYTIHVVAAWELAPSADSAKEQNRLRYNRWKEVEQKFNCTIVFDVVTDLYDQLEASAMSGEPLGDVLNVRGEKVHSLASQGLLYPIGDVVNLEKKQYVRDNEDLFTVGDKIYAFSIMRPQVEATIFFNKGIFKRFGLETPYQMMEKGTWTMENFAKLAKSATRDTNGDGKIDIYGMSAITIDPEITYFINAFGGATVNKDKSGKFVSGLKDAKTLEALNFLRKMNLNDKSTLMPTGKPTWDWGFTQFNNGKVAMCQSNVTSGIITGAKENLTDGYGIVPLPLGPGQKEYTQISQSQLCYVMQSSLDKDLAKKIGKVMDAYWAPLVDEEREDALAEDEFEQFSCDEESVANLMMLSKLPNPTFPQFGFGNAWWDSVNNQFYHALVGNTTVATAMDTCNPVFQADLDVANDRLAP